MSYDIDLEPTVKECEQCKRPFEGVSGPNPTYNLTGIFDLALTGEPLPNPDVGEGAVVLLGAKTDRPRGLRILNGRVASDTVATMHAALLRLRSPAMHKQFRALEPDNGWGTMDDAVATFERLIKLATDHPTLVWNIH